MNRGTRIDNYPFITVYTLTFNQCALVTLLLQDLMSQDYPSHLYEIVMLDDGSSDDTLEQLARQAKQSPVIVKLLHCRHRFDYSNAKRWNQCIQSAEAATEVFVQVDDVRVRQDFLFQHAKWHVGLVDWLVTGAKFEHETLTWDLRFCRRHALAGPNAGAAEITSYKAIWGASLSFSKRAMARAYACPHDVPFDERMTGWGYHEVEFALRMQKAGVRLAYDPAAGVFHRKHTPATEKARGLDRTALIEAGEDRNVQYILKKHGLEELEKW